MSGRIHISDQSFKSDSICLASVLMAYSHGSLMIVPVEEASVAQWKENSIEIVDQNPST